MSRFKTIKTIASTLTIAAAVGYVVQYGEQGTPLQPEAAAENALITPGLMVMATNAQGEAVFGVPPKSDGPVDHSVTRRSVVPVDAVYQELAVPRLGTVQATPVPGCETQISARRMVAAVVELTVQAPCEANQTYVVKHEGLRVAAVTNGDGVGVIEIPALMANADFEVFINNVQFGATQIFVPELRQYDRAVLQWMTQTNMRLHALEDGAAIGDTGHIWSASIHGPEDTREGLHGFVVYVGDNNADIPYQAEVYTHPAGQLGREGRVDLQIGVSVTADNCGREVDAETIQTNAGENLVVSTIRAQMPNCDEQGEIVFLTGQFADLTLVSN
ncbi:MAG: hypothetical protein AAGF56_10155 [Pseudomonadota bacterium]